MNNLHHFSRLWMLVVRYWCLHPNVESELPGPICGHRGGPHQNNLCWEGQPRSLQNISQGDQASRCWSEWIPNNSSEQNWRLWRARQSVLLPGCDVFQVWYGQEFVGQSVEPLLGQHALQQLSSHQCWIYNWTGKEKHSKGMFLL